MSEFVREGTASLHIALCSIPCPLLVCRNSAALGMVQAKFTDRRDVGQGWLAFSSRLHEFCPSPFPLWLR